MHFIIYANMHFREYKCIIEIVKCSRDYFKGRFVNIHSLLNSRSDKHNTLPLCTANSRPSHTHNRTKTPQDHKNVTFTAVQMFRGQQFQSQQFYCFKVPSAHCIL